MGPVKIIVKLITIFIISIIYSGCNSREIDYIVPTTVNRLVVYCFFNPDSVWSVRVSKFANALDKEESNLWISNAKVVLFENNQVIDTLFQSTTGNYISSKGMKPTFDKEYFIEVKVSGYISVKSKTEKLPSAITIKNVIFYDSLLAGIFPSEFYSIQNSCEYKNKTIDVVVDNALKGQFYKVFLSSNLNENSSVTLSKNAKKDFVEYYGYNCTTLEAIHDLKVLIQTPFIPKVHNFLKIYTISESYLLYENSYAEYDFVVGTTFLLSPKNNYSNIIGGAGLMAGYTSNVLDLNDK